LVRFVPKFDGSPPFYPISEEPMGIITGTLLSSILTAKQDLRFSMEMGQST
jgi:hypothetical protein